MGVSFTLANEERDMTDVLQQATLIVDALQKVRDEALHHGRTVTEKGKGIDDHQVHAERLAYLATEVEAARALLTYAQAAQGQGNAEIG
jgi:alkylation response protein AidB-like acyl-CoA dehydrogenase